MAPKKSVVIAKLLNITGMIVWKSFVLYPPLMLQNLSEAMLSLLPILPVSPSEKYKNSHATPWLSRGDVKLVSEASFQAKYVNMKLEMVPDQQCLIFQRNQSLVINLEKFTL